MKTLFHVTPISNMENILKNGLLPQLGERASRLVGEKEGIYLFPDYTSCEDALGSWFGDEFEYLEEEVVTLKVELPDDFPLEMEVQWELISRIKIEPECISFYKNEG